MRNCRILSPKQNIYATPSSQGLGIIIEKESKESMALDVYKGRHSGHCRVAEYMNSHKLWKLWKHAEDLHKLKPDKILPDEVSGAQSLPLT